MCFVCEYDAVPELGHAAGHNLCSEASVAAALAIKTCVQQRKFGGKVRHSFNAGFDFGVLSSAEQTVDNLRVGLHFLTSE